MSEICPNCNGAGGDINTWTCGMCNGSGGVPRPQSSTEPVAVWLHEHEAGERVLSWHRLTESDKKYGWTETPLYPASALEAARREALAALKAMVDEYDPYDNLQANGCWHGFTPAKSCPNDGCKDKRLQELLDAALKENTNG